LTRLFRLYILGIFSPFFHINQVRRVAQRSYIILERLVYAQESAGSNPAAPTKYIFRLFIGRIFLQKKTGTNIGRRLFIMSPEI